MQGNEARSQFFSHKKRSRQDTLEDQAIKIVNNYKASKLQRKFKDKDKDEENNKFPICAICLDNCLNQCSPNGCNHVFCFSCISEWGKMTPVCPLCKIEFLTVINPFGQILGTFEKKIADADDMNDNLLLDAQQNESDLDSVNPLETQDRSHGYELDGFVVDDDFIEYDENEVDIYNFH